jgi:hypothetical protein
LGSLEDGYGVVGCVQLVVKLALSALDKTEVTSLIVLGNIVMIGTQAFVVA